MKKIGINIWLTRRFSGRIQKIREEVEKVKPLMRHFQKQED